MLTNYGQISTLSLGYNLVNTPFGLIFNSSADNLTLQFADKWLGTNVVSDSVREPPFGMAMFLVTHMNPGLLSPSELLAKSVQQLPWDNQIRTSHR
jgi:hypothetical protein